jgi:hypothetical protein
LLIVFSCLFFTPFSSSLFLHEATNGKDDQEESNEPDYDEDKDQIEEEQEEKQEKLCQQTKSFRA